MLRRNEASGLFSGRNARDASRFVHVPEQSYGSRQTANGIIQGENLDVLKVLVPILSGKVRCIYIDPPYNNRERYTHYHDDLAHEVWLDSITSRLSYLGELLTEDGRLWISIDDREGHYLKVAADKVLKRQNFMTTIVC